MEELQARHRKEQRDLVAKITQKKKQASKKTRKGVNDECDQLERDLRDQQAREIAEFEGGPASNGASEVEQADEDGDEPQPSRAESELEFSTKNLFIDDDAAPEDSGDAVSGQGQRKKPNRAKARLAKRAAEQDAMRAEAAAEAANMPDQKEVERKRMQEEFQRRGLSEKVIRADGHCLYSAVADQLHAKELTLQPMITTTTIENGDSESDVPPFRRVRHAAAAYIEQHEDDFVPFLEEPMDSYLQKIRDTGEWGGQLELLALAKTYGVNINVLQGSGRLEKIEGGKDGEDDKDIWLAYYRHGFGLGEHYNSLRKAP